MTTMAAYKASEKRWKGRDEQDILQDEQIIDLRNLSERQRKLVRQVGTFQWDDAHRPQPVLEFGAFGESHRGFLVIPNALNALAQLRIAHASLTEFTEEPHRTNMHLQNEHVPHIWNKAREKYPLDTAKSKLLGRLHWAASGFHYDWTARKYHRGQFSEVPPLLEQLGSRVAQACGMSLVAEAVIVNFYKKSSTMGGHQDDVEYTMDHPVVSLTLGSSAVFLKGGLSKDEAPLQTFLRSGDIAVMGGNSRLSFHGVARVLPTPFQIEEDDWTALLAGEVAEQEDNFHAIRKYLGQNRININIRQVYALGAKQKAEEEEADGGDKGRDDDRSSKSERCLQVTDADADPSCDHPSGSDASK
ncbi:TPA: hypothetical protein N0F65_006442 [Lagenidium giganteum]|uniref:Fe2OG dioxygenase domain-containing protein n=1 Tax=Lagenidium giganteum TaxID=4803 RepID=A0AAV2YZM8_9STRA|nr:TPA: hypothetical protein N0F65_006442 [Lagenidium giganteum]